MGYKMEGCEYDIMKIIEAQGDDSEGEVTMMGDFNKVQLQSDRFCSVFHARDVEVFNSFILNEEVEGFRKFIVDTWSSAPRDNRNDMRILMKKLKFLKIKIREWNFGHISSSRVEMKHLQEELNRLDTEIESGKVTDVTSGPVAFHPFLNSTSSKKKKQAKRNEKPGTISKTGVARSYPGSFPQ
nr:hypothetical protein [Tanacetum cinerariifolium]